VAVKAVDIGGHGLAFLRSISRSIYQRAFSRS